MRTIAFTVHEPPYPPLDRIERAEALEFVRDGFSAFAAAIPPLWMAVNRLWLTLLLYLLISMGASLGLAMLGVDKSLIGLINLAANVVLGFEAPSLVRWTLGRRDWTEIGTVVGRNRAECERRFFDAWLDTQPLMRRPVTPSTAPSVSARSPKLVMSAPEAAAAAVEHGLGLSAAGDVPAPSHQRPRSLWRRLIRR